MAEPASGHASGTARADTRRAVLAAVGALVLAAVLWGGYSHRWPWTGINGGTATLWDWLHLLLLPLAIVVLPVWLRADTRVGSRTKRRSVTGLTAFIVLVILGYTVPWSWTGFRGNTVWDWLKLLLLPLAVVLVPRLAERRRGWGIRHRVAMLAALGGFTAIVLGGYLGRWGWTGFSGNTLWDWLNLLFLPLLLPTVIVPALTPRMMGEVVYLDAEGNPLPAEEEGAGRPAGEEGAARPAAAPVPATAPVPAAAPVPATAAVPMPPPGSPGGPKS